MKKKENRLTSKYNWIITISFFVFVVGLGLGSALIPDKEVSNSERRHYASFPKLTWKTVGTGSFMDDLEEYLLDQFVARDWFRTLKTEVETTIFGKKDANNYVLWQDGLYELDMDWKKTNVTRAAKEFAGLQSRYFLDADVYYALIPDKSYFLPKEQFPETEDEWVISQMKQYLTNADYIDLYPYLTIEDYYCTDLHWKQESIFDVSEVILTAMQDKQAEQTSEYEILEVTDTFYGGYAGASAYVVKPDSLCIVKNETIEQAIVYDYEKKQEVSVYAPEKLEGMDFYDYYLWGARALLTIKNPMAETEEKLLLFRDSFGSSIAPLLLEGYKEITLVDFRYISSEYLSDLIDLESYEDVLFLYSQKVLKNSDSLKF